MALKPIDGPSFALIVELIDAEEHRLVRQGSCEQSEANDWVAFDCIAETSGIIQGATAYVASDERMGARFFLQGLPGAKTKLRSWRRLQSCEELLSTQPHRFFANFEDILRLLFQRTLQTIAHPGALRFNGIGLLAAAALPEFRTELRRELRRRGYDDRLLVRDDDLTKRVSNSQAILRMIDSRKPGLMLMGNTGLDD